MKNIQKTFLLTLAAFLVVGVILLVIPAWTVSAQTPAPAAPQTTPAPSTVDPAQRAARLERAFQVEKNTLDRQSKRLAAADTAVDRIQKLIDTLKGKGIDASKLQSALNDFKVKLSDAKTFHTTAGDILNTHAGFDDAGKVTAPAQAVDTLKAAHQALADVRSTLSGSLQTVRQAAKDLRQYLKTTNLRQ